MKDILLRGCEGEMDVKFKLKPLLALWRNSAKT